MIFELFSQRNAEKKILMYMNMKIFLKNFETKYFL